MSVGLASLADARALRGVGVPKVLTDSRQPRTQRAFSLSTLADELAGLAEFESNAVEHVPITQLPARRLKSQPKIHERLMEIFD